jgi:hypothetical protein
MMAFMEASSFDHLRGGLGGASARRSDQFSHAGQPNCARNQEKVHRPAAATAMLRRWTKPPPDAFGYSGGRWCTLDRFLTEFLPDGRSGAPWINAVFPLLFCTCRLGPSRELGSWRA